MNSAMTDLVKMIALAVVFIYLIMVAQFQSLMSPFIVMFTIPLAFTGGLLALWLTGSELSIMLCWASLFWRAWW
ncbi:MAG: efflux RND transporter permease subunit [Ruthenibacterium lactatiformans]